MFVPKFNYIFKQRRRDMKNNERNRSCSGSGSESNEQQQRRRSSSMMSGRYSSSVNLGGGEFDSRRSTSMRSGANQRQQHLHLDCTHSDEIRISAIGTEA